MPDPLDPRSIDQLIQAFQSSANRGLTGPPEGRWWHSDADDALAAAGEGSVIRLCGLIMVRGLQERASDVYLEPQDGSLRVQFRVDGVLRDVVTLPADMGQGLITRIKMVAGMNILEHHRPLNGQLTFEFDGESLHSKPDPEAAGGDILVHLLRPVQLPEFDGEDVDIRVSTAPTIWGEKCVLRMSRTLLKFGDRPTCCYATS